MRHRVPIEFSDSEAVEHGHRAARLLFVTGDLVHLDHVQHTEIVTIDEPNGLVKLHDGDRLACLVTPHTRRTTHAQLQLWQQRVAAR